MDYEKKFSEILDLIVEQSKKTEEKINEYSNYMDENDCLPLDEQSDFDNLIHNYGIYCDFLSAVDNLKYLRGEFI